MGGTAFHRELNVENGQQLALTERASPNNAGGFSDPWIPRDWDGRTVGYFYFYLYIFHFIVVKKESPR